MMKTKSLKAALLLLLMLLMALTGTLGAGASETAAETDRRRVRRCDGAHAAAD